MERKEIIAENEKYFSFFTKLPKILTIALAVIFFIWSIVDPAVFQSSYLSSNYGIMQLNTFFGAMIIWWLIGAVVCVATYFLSKLAVSYKILHIYYLQEIKEKIEK